VNAAPINLNPGSPAAVAIGCTCPSDENQDGRYPTWGGCWRVADTCDVHNVRLLSRALAQFATVPA